MSVELAQDLRYVTPLVEGSMDYSSLRKALTTMQCVPDWKDTEITRLRDEVGRLTYKATLYDGLRHNITQLERERDEALGEVRRLKEICADFKRQTGEAVQAKEEALDRLQRLEQYKRSQEALYADVPKPTQGKKESTVLEHRLQRAEASVLKWEEEGDTRVHEQIVELTGHNDYLERRLRRAEAVVEATKRHFTLHCPDPHHLCKEVQEALAAWEEGTT